MVTMQGQGGYGELRFSSRKPGSQKPLIFEMSDKQLKQCDSEFCRLIADSATLSVDSKGKGCHAAGGAYAGC